MIVINQTFAFLLCTITLNLLVLSTKPATGRCHRSCGHKHLQFPFGFSNDCEIPLNCSSRNGEISIGDFKVENVTSTSLLLNMPLTCNRPIHSLTQLFSKNYAFTTQNGFLFGNCSSSSSSNTNGRQDCMISTDVVETRLLQLRNCSRDARNLTCFRKFGHENRGLLSFSNVSETRCSLLLSSIVVEEGDGSGGGGGARVAVEFERVELRWWLEGSCSGDGCASNAECVDIVSPLDGRPGFICSCKHGMLGDGFNRGGGCRKASSKCNPSKYMSGHCGGTTRVGVLIGGIFAGAFFMSGLAVLCYFIRRKSSSLKSQKSTRRLLTEAAVSCSVPFHTYREIERATTGFSEKHRLGTGAYGTVYAGKMHNDEWVAIKKIRHRDVDGIEQIMNEIKLLSTVNHPNLVRLLGFCVEKGEQILVYEFMPNGTLSQHLQRERGTGLPWTVRLTIATETAQAIAHLHSAKNPPIYHRDIKSSNILLDGNFKSKVADFGLSRLGMMTESSHISTAPQGTPGYLDPQYHQTFHLSDKSDVYSFGVVLVEIITALKVVDFSRPHSQVNLAALAVEKIGKGCLDDIIDPFLEPHRDAWTLTSVHKVAELAFRCLAFHRDMRPTMMEVAAELECIRLSGWSPSEDHVFNISCTSLSIKSENSHTSNKVEVDGSRRLALTQKNLHALSMGEVIKDSSPVSVHEPWYSEQSSPSSSSLLDNVIN